MLPKGACRKVRLFFLGRLTLRDICKMRLIALTLATMLAFAANSVLNRFAVAMFQTDPALFAVVRTVSGAVLLAGLLMLKGQRPPMQPRLQRLFGGGALALYMIGFSMAYLTLDAGVGALILFGGVQITMFGWAVVERSAIPLSRWIGALVSMAGLAWLVWPAQGQAAIDLGGIILMGAAAIGWGAYSLAGRISTDPLAATSANFIVAVPLVLPLLILGGNGTWPGIGLAILAGAVTSGLGYALWYQVVPQLGATRAAVAQLSVPILAALGGAAVLAERPDARFILAAGLVLGGIPVGLVPWRQRRIGSRGS